MPRASSAKALISHDTALEFWRERGAVLIGNPADKKNATNEAEKFLMTGSATEIGCDAVLKGRFDFPVHVITGKHARLRSRDVVLHKRSSLPPRSFVDARNGYLVSTPEHCFLQMAEDMDLVPLIQLGCEMCGTYSLVRDPLAPTQDSDEAFDPYSDLRSDSMWLRRQTPESSEASSPGAERIKAQVRRPATISVGREVPLTTTTSLKSFLGYSRGRKHVKKASRAAGYVIDGSASPMETVLALLLSLPYSLGGYGIEPPRLNHEVRIPEYSRRFSDRERCVCDLYWPGARLDVEYDSDKHHTGSERIARDSMRRNSLIDAGVTVIVVSTSQLFSARSFDNVAHQVARRLGKRLRYDPAAHGRASLELRSALFRSLGFDWK